MKYFGLILFLSFLYSINAQGISNYEEAYRIEKLAPRLSISLYESLVKSPSLNSKIQKVVINRLFYLYLKYNLYDEIFLLNKAFPKDKSREKQEQIIIKKLAKSVGIKELDMGLVIDLCLKNNDESKKVLLEQYKKNELNPYLLFSIFSLKITAREFETLSYLISEIPDINPVLQMLYFVNSNDPKSKSEIKKITQLTSLTEEQKVDILYLFGTYLRNIKKYKMSVRYLHMVQSYSKNDPNMIAKTKIEIAKSLIMGKKENEACEYIKDIPFQIRNASDEVLHLYCKGNLTKWKKILRPALDILAEKENGLFYKKMIELVE